MKILQSGDELFHEDARSNRRKDRDMTKLIVTFRCFENAPKKSYEIESDTEGDSRKWFCVFPVEHKTVCVSWCVITSYRLMQILTHSMVQSPS